MSGLNRWQGFITLAADAELRFTQGGQGVLNFRGACNETFTDREGNKKETTTWIPCVLWGKRGEALARHLTKGMKVYVEGALRIGTYEKDGEKRTKVEINVTEIEFTGGRRADASQDDAAPPQRGDHGGGGSGGGHGRGGYGGRGQARTGANGGSGGGYGGKPNPNDDGRGSEDYGGGYGGEDDGIPF